MFRRQFLVGAGSTALSVAGIGAAVGSESDSVRSERFRVVDREGGSDPAIEITTRGCGTRVEVEGSIVGRDGCQTAQLRDATLDDGVLEVTVETARAEDAGDVCTLAEVTVDYVAQFALADAPDRVVVRHDGVDESTARHSVEDCPRQQ